MKVNVLHRKKDESHWYSDVLFAADIIDDRYALKGAAVWKPYGLSIMNAIKRRWDELFQNAGIEEALFPLILPLEFCEINKDWWEGFKELGYQVSAGGKHIGVLKPTGEPVMYPMYKQWIRSKADLPIRMYQNAHSYRYETSHTRPLLRTREISVWHEIHTVHATKEEAEAEFALHCKLWDVLWEDCALASLKLDKPAWDNFPGAVGTVDFHSTTATGRVMENGSVCNLGQAYAKKFDLSFMEEGEKKYAWQLCTGNGARLLGGLLLVHGDDCGLVLPPRIAPIKVVVVPILKKGHEAEIASYAQGIAKKFNAKIDDRDLSVGAKFAEWDLKGIPLRLEVGLKEMQDGTLTYSCRDLKEKHTVADFDASEIMAQMQTRLADASRRMLEEQLQLAESLEEIGTVIDSGGIAQVSWCGSRECFDAIEAQREGSEGFGSSLDEHKGTCVACSKPACKLLHVAKKY